MFVNRILKLADTTKLTKKMNSEKDNKIFTNLNFKKLNLNFDKDEAKHELKKLVDKFGLFNYPIGEAKKRYYYKGISLTSLKNQEDKLKGSFFIYDDKNNKIGNEYYVGMQNNAKLINLKKENYFDFETTEACTPFFKKIINNIKFPVTRVRILELMPGGIIPPHIDYSPEYGIKIHSYIETNDDVICEVAGEKFKIPDDGSFYWLDISKPHSVINLGKTSRISICINLNIYDDPMYKNVSLEDILEQI